MGDIFEKCYKFDDADKVRAIDLYPYFTPIESAQETEVTINGKRVLMLGSNSYLGLTHDPRVIEAAKNAIDKYGTGCAGSRFLNGTLDLHEEVERKLAIFIKKDAALLYSTGFQVNLGVISTLALKDDYILADKMNHASIVDGCKLSYANTVRYRHNDIADLEDKIKKLPEDAGKFIVVDGIFSMEGDIVKLPELVEIKKKYNARLLVDDAHSVGVLGDNGRGTPEHFHLEDEVDLIMNTFSKTFAALGGYVAGDYKVIDYLKHFSRALIFSASLPPAVLGVVEKVLDIIKEEPWRRKRLWEITHFMHKEFNEMGFHTGDSETPIIPIRIGDMMTTFKMRKMLLDEGVFINPIVPPAVGPTDCLVRVSFMATHTDEQLQFALDKIRSIGKKLGVI